ncbi:MAG: hypothetical protein KDM81_02940 [Verrucomicrobiae bacterium]|nr:hypothetical protein [Verrucomicrobiae bacterium]MCP5520267.1 hypothetical protein [Verrucomicrobiales bacterium]
MKTTLFPICLLSVLVPVLGAGAADRNPQEAEARQHAANVIREVQLGTTVEHYRQVRTQLLQAELDDRLAEVKAGAGGGGLSPEERSMRSGRREVLQRTSAELEERIRALILREAKAQAEAAQQARSETARWAGTSRDGDEELHLVLDLRGDEGRFVIEDATHRLAGQVKIRGEECDLQVEETSDDLTEYRGKTVKGLCRRMDDRLAVVLSEPGKPERPTKLEAEGDSKGFLLERK